MKRARAAVCVVLALAVMFAFSACTGCESGKQSAFVFLSVRLKGGDGKVTAFAQNEFALGSSVIPVTLVLYRSDGQKSDEREMTEIARTESDDLNIFEKLETFGGTGGGGYFCAVLDYTLNGETRSLRSEIVCYDADGNRK